MQKKNKLLKIKIYIMVFLVIIAAVIIINEGVKNSFKTTANKTQSSPQIKGDNKTDNKNAEEKIAAEEQKKKDEKQKELEAKYEQGRHLFESGNYDEAINIEDLVLKEDSNYYPAYSVKGIALCYSHRFQEGVANINKSLAMKPDYGYARFNKALAYELYGYYDQALKYYDDALKVENFVWSYYGKAAIYGRKGDVADTVKYLKIAISMQPNIKDVAKDEKDFDNVKSSKEFQDLIK